MTTADIFCTILDVCLAKTEGDVYFIQVNSEFVYGDTHYNFGDILDVQNKENITGNFTGLWVRKVCESTETYLPNSVRGLFRIRNDLNVGSRPVVVRNKRAVPQPPVGPKPNERNQAYKQTIMSNDINDNDNGDNNNNKNNSDNNNNNSNSNNNNTNNNGDESQYNNTRHSNRQSSLVETNPKTFPSKVTVNFIENENSRFEVINSMASTQQEEFKDNATIMKPMKNENERVSPFTAVNNSSKSYNSNSNTVEQPNNGCHDNNKNKKVAVYEVLDDDNEDIMMINRPPLPPKSTTVSTDKANNNNNNNNCLLYTSPSPRDS